MQLRTQNLQRSAPCLSGLLAMLLPALAWSQGTLTPPGAPAPTMKTLAQIEPRIAITTSGAVTLTNSGSYYLTTNITVSSGDAITIATNNVTLDLNGFTVLSTASPAAGVGVYLSGKRKDIIICNGQIRGSVTNKAGIFSGPGFEAGISHSDSDEISNVKVSRLCVSGCLAKGIRLNKQSTVVESCTVNSVGEDGILAANVSDSVATECGNGAAISANTAANCRGESVGSVGTGLNVDNAQNCFGRTEGNGNGLTAITANNCYGYSVLGSGVYVGNAKNCYGLSTGGQWGLFAQNVATGCYGYAAGAAGSERTGLAAETAENCRGLSDNGVGLKAVTAENCVARSTGNIGLIATNATGCRGESGGNYYGLFALTANNCSGKSVGGFGLAASTAINCQGTSTSADGLSATIAQNCQGISSSGKGLSADQVFNCSGRTETGTTGLRFTKLGAVSWGERGTPAGTNYVLGAGMTGPVNLP